MGLIGVCVSEITVSLNYVIWTDPCDHVHEVKSPFLRSFRKAFMSLDDRHNVLIDDVCLRKRTPQNFPGMCCAAT